MNDLTDEDLENAGLDEGSRSKKTQDTDDKQLSQRQEIELLSGVRIPSADELKGSLTSAIWILKKMADKIDEASEVYAYDQKMRQQLGWTIKNLEKLRNDVYEK